MLFIMGITEGRKDFDFNQVMNCAVCHKYGSYRVFMLYTVLSLFFIPVFKWNKRYFVTTGCCGTMYQLDAAVGRSIEKGLDVEITPEDLSIVSSMRNSSFGYRRCASCGYETAEDFAFCPKCGKPLDS